jgi:hypothetical protein
MLDDDPMKWFALAVALVVAGAVAGLAITWGWRDGDSPAADDQDKARAYANELGALCDPPCQIVTLRRIAPGVWKLNERNSEGERVCLDIVVRHFRPLADGKFAGVVRARCWGAGAN